MDAKIKIATRAAKELCDGDVVNLGIGLPTLVAGYIDPGCEIILHSENGILGMDKPVGEDFADKSTINAGGQYVTVKKGAAFFDSAASFGIARGGHIDKTILGALQVDAEGNLASHIVPGKIVPGMGGAMDLAAGSKRIIVVTTHTAKGEPKILPKVTLPLTASKKVSLIITELAVIEVTSRGLLLREIAAETTVDEVVRLTAAPLIIADDMGKF